MLDPARALTVTHVSRFSGVSLFTPTPTIPPPWPVMWRHDTRPLPSESAECVNLLKFRLVRSPHP